MPIQPFVVGQWVHGEKFYGRRHLIEEILHGNRDGLWLLGTRRVGKTSVLKHVEWLTASQPELGYFPLFWDFQGADDPGELHTAFRDGLLDAECRMASVGIAVSEFESDELFRSLSRLRRRLRACGFKLLLLCDEVEELVSLHDQYPALLGKLRRTLQSSENLRSVLASTIRLMRLAHRDQDTSPFLHGFTPPLYIHALSDESALALIRQANLPTASRPRIDDHSAEVIRSHCDNHPYLIQLVSKRFLELGDLEEAVGQVGDDPMVSNLFAGDFETLSRDERRIIRGVAERNSMTSQSIQADLRLRDDTLAGYIQRLEHLGYLRRNTQGRFVLINYFFRRWFLANPAVGGRLDPISSPNSELVDLLVLGLSDSGEPEPEYDARKFLGDRYKLIEEAGRGAHGFVYKVHDRLMKKDIALKVLRQELSANPDTCERFRQEIVLTLEINHPNIVTIYHLGEKDGLKFLTMRWIDGKTLSHEIAEKSPLAPSKVVELGRKIASALGALHARRVLHRDLKPQNVLIDTRGEPFLSDFGLARLIGHPGITRDGKFVGTPAYASPEQASVGELDERSDIYALGLILFELATGRRPFVAASTDEVLRMHRRAPLPDPGRFEPGLPTGLAGIIRRCLEKDPQDRFQNAAELERALESTIT